MKAPAMRIPVHHQPSTWFWQDGRSIRNSCVRMVKMLEPKLLLSAGETAAERRLVHLNRVLVHHMFFCLCWNHPLQHDVERT